MLHLQRGPPPEKNRIKTRNRFYPDIKKQNGSYALHKGGERPFVYKTSY